ncbi:FG-GAP repeat protein [Thioalkalivibrio nitratireducens DSM 14787]|uniref:FG-GAP repeat protein n=1 Tax=Thioalkalivibrio nitratireducens (strain DSM 14787 / UNIQEM 213 / ALEN2) TaxID=1255043 RepID=L0E144_THIND|nr:VCBS repeat-containing protein [Thioalkalivibrio nitratireducens]AGA34962.1 FG-GAP repeat protein [Thioalkalivibrio nitratireducens DSM 14787]
MSNEPGNLLEFMNDGTLGAPFFEKVTLANQQDDGYWIQAVDINGNGKLDLVTSGLAVGRVVWYENPTWKRRTIADFPLPVAIDTGDIAGNGRNDLVISHNYGNCMFWCRPEDGKISWLENPGHYDDDELWKVHFVSDLMAAHRLQLGHFTQTERLELMALPVVGCQPYGKGVHEPVAVTIFDRPDDVHSAPSWRGRIIDNESFRIIHGVVREKFGGRSGVGLDSVLLASEEGISWFYYDVEQSRWQTIPFGAGDQTGQAGTFRGCGNVAYGRVGNDPYAYIATIDPFHGNIVTVYTRKPGQALTDHPWRRTILDTFGPFDPETQGPGHHVVAGDFDGDGDDEFLVALRGPLPHQGVYYYKAIDVEQGLFERWRVSSASAARIAVGDFDGDGRLDFATTGYYTPGYYLCDNSQVNIYLNRFASL